MFEITNPITNERLQVAENDFEKPMDWQSAVKECENLGNGWRLPTVFEFAIIYKEIHEKNTGNFRSCSLYWTNTEYDKKHAYFFHVYDLFEEGYYVKSEKNYVRAVRTL